MGTGWSCVLWVQKYMQHRLHISTYHSKCFLNFLALPFLPPSPKCYCKLTPAALRGFLPGCFSQTLYQIIFPRKGKNDKAKQQRHLAYGQPPTSEEATVPQGSAPKNKSPLLSGGNFVEDPSRGNHQFKRT